MNSSSPRPLIQRLYAWEGFQNCQVAMTQLVLGTQNLSQSQFPDYNAGQKDKWSFSWWGFAHYEMLVIWESDSFFFPSATAYIRFLNEDAMESQEWITTHSEGNSNFVANKVATVSEQLIIGARLGHLKMKDRAQVCFYREGRTVKNHWRRTCTHPFIRGFQQFHFQSCAPEVSHPKGVV